METLGAFFVEVGKSLTKFMRSRYATLKNLEKNICSLKKELQSLSSRRDDITEDIDLAKAEGKHPARQVVAWLKKVESIEEEIDRKLQPYLQEFHSDASVHGQGCLFDSNMLRRYHLSKNAAKKCDAVKQLITESHFPTMWDALRHPDTPIQHIPAPSLVGQKAEEKLKQLMDYLADDKIKRIAVYGMGGSGKTTLVKTLNNQLQSSASKLCDMVIWIPVSNDLDMKKVQSRVAERLNLVMNAEESTECRACRLHQALKSGKRFLLILDDVWEKIDLDTVGIPQGDHQTNCKIVLTTRSLAVCREMMTEKQVKMEFLNEEEAWDLFARNAGNVVESEDINPLARAVARECGGLPLALETMGKSMRDKTMIQLWRNALCRLKHSAPHFGSVHKVHLRLALSYNSLPSKIHKQCFLFCSLYPENSLITERELIYGWKADGLVIDEHQTLEESFNDGLAKVEYLKDACMLEQGEHTGTVKMHSVLRDVALRISSNRKETGYFSSSWLGMQAKVQSSFRRVSYMNNSITSLPSQLLGCSNLTVLFLQCSSLCKLPDGVFRELRVLRFLSLSTTQISSLPSSLLQLTELHTLLLRDCSSLENLPQLGALCKLQVLDLSGTRIRELPKDMGTLTHLRDLNLSHTNHLESIIAGSISGLYSLEALDMTSSAYKWDVECKVEGAAFDEIISLQRLSALHIRLDTVDCVALDSDGSWFGRLKEFSIWIGPRSSDSSYLPIQHEEKRVILRGVDLLRRGLEGLWYNASSLDLVACGGISNFSDIVSNRKLDGLPNLRFLTISNCDCITSFLIGEETLRSTLLNLEHLTLNGLNNLETMADRVLPRGCLGKLKIIKVKGCRRLKTLISLTLLKRVQNVEVIQVSDCRRMKQIIVNISYETLPKLKYIELREMDSLTAISSKAVKWSALERIEVSDCPKLKKLPLRAENAANLKEIRGDICWWNGLKWQNDGDKMSLQQRFQACTDSTLLLRECTEA